MKVHLTSIMSLTHTGPDSDTGNKWKALEWAEPLVSLLQDMTELAAPSEWPESSARKTSNTWATNSKWSVAHALDTSQETHQFLQFWASQRGSHNSTQRTSKEASKQFTDKRGGFKLSQISSIMDPAPIKPVQPQGIDKVPIIEIQQFIKEYFENSSDLIPEHNIIIRNIIFWPIFWICRINIRKSNNIILIKSLTNKHWL